MRILFTDFFGIMAGSSFSSFYLARGLSERGHEVTFVCKKGSFIESLLTDLVGVEVISLKNTGKLNLITAFEISKIVRDRNVQVINAQGSTDRYCTILARWIFGMRGILIHTRRQKPDVLGGKMKAWFYSKGTDKIIAVSSSIKRDLINSGIPGDCIEIIHNGIPESKWQQVDFTKTQQLRDRYGINDGDFVVGFVSRIKQQDQLLNALKLVSIPAKVIMVGIWNEYDELNKLVSELPERHEVYFTGELPNDQVLHFYSLFTVKVLASNMEGFSQSLLESMAIGTPVIATESSGNPDLITHGENGLFFNEGDIQQLAEHLEKIYADKNLATQLSKNAMELVKSKYGMENVISTYENCFEKWVS